MLLEAATFIVGFVVLIKGADFLVKGGSSLGKRFGMSDLVIGLTIVSFGTSMPELLVNVISSLQGSSELAIGNVLGSNIANILLILGVSALVCPLPITRNTYFIEIPFSLTATLLVGFLANASLFYHVTDLYISRFDGVVLLFFFFLFLGYIFMTTKEKKEAAFKTTYKEESLFKSIGLTTLGILGLYFGGDWIVDGALYFAGYFDVSESFIGLTVVALGTSLPELVTSAVAAFKKNTDIAVGNVVGSNIFNMLWILGASAVIKPLPFDVISNTDILMIIASSSMLIMAVVIGKRPVISRPEAIFFLIFYFAYIYYLVDRG
ncbi:calcium/sodium antiporter [Fulvivirgaceae bacterium BMA10]|uniref:Calcium/sodium antiporter n=1 Tax=Splendidivirga corallicola TaxID=3051826 RepID=A0ABT8KWS2_9BACT|nr:calcium/sodium antiporter [Fulvivirgaceae bacterium BMA10]